MIGVFGKYAFKSDEMVNSRPGILMTGATGMVGAQLLARLLRRQIPVVVVVRAKDERDAIRRIDSILGPFESKWQRRLNRPTTLLGDMRSPNLGLSQDHLHLVARDCSSVIHAAASLTFRPAVETADGEPYRTNVTGTQNLLELCKTTGITDFHYVSTAYVCGTRSGVVHESDLELDQEFSNDYERSKVQAELLVRAAGHLRQVTVYRPSIVIDSEGLSPIGSARTIYGAFSLFKLLTEKFGLPDSGRWFPILGFDGNERKNLVEAAWVADLISGIVATPKLHGTTYHVTASTGTQVDSIESAFHRVLGLKGSVAEKATNPETADVSAAEFPLELILKLAGPYFDSFSAYYRDDPFFSRTNTAPALATLGIHDQGSIEIDSIARITKSPGVGPEQSIEPDESLSLARTTSLAPTPSPQPSTADHEKRDADDPIVIVGYEVRLPGADGVEAYEQLLYDGKSSYAPLPPERLDASLYFDPKRGAVGKTYTQLGGCVDESALDAEIDTKIESLGNYDLVYRHFASVAARCWRRAGADKLTELTVRTGVFVGHSGGTQSGGGLAMATLAETVANRIADLQHESTRFQSESPAIAESLTAAIREGRPRRDQNAPQLNAYTAASLVAQLLELKGPREVIDAACASSLFALDHAMTMIRHGRIDAAVVGGATFNNVDNLILFSQSQACSDSESCPFDRNASGLVSSEGYVAVLVTRQSIAEKFGLKIHACVEAIGLSSDGRGKSLWAPRTEGQQLAIRRGYDAAPLHIDYQEAHATSTLVGDATELHSLTTILGETADKDQLLTGSVKGNLGHTLEAAGLVGLVKVLIAMRRNVIPPSINLENPTDLFDWSKSKVQVLTKAQSWPRGETPRRAAVNSFGIGGLNAHAVVSDAPASDTSASRLRNTKSPGKTSDPIAIVGRGIVLAGAHNLSQWQHQLKTGHSGIIAAPADRWRASDGIDQRDRKSPFSTPTNVGGYIQDYHFDGQPYRIPPKQVRLANPAQMMLIDAVAQAIHERDGGQWALDRHKVSIVVGTVFGGDFSNQLQVGLRLPEIEQHLHRILLKRGYSRPEAENLSKSLTAKLLDDYPAILDETGSFTASTLASRIAKTFDLMGGACAVDADDASGGLALLLAADQLIRGDVEAVICGVASRSLDLVAMEQLDFHDKLVRSGRVEDIPPDGSRILAGEGVGVVMLERLSTAEANGRTVLGIIDRVDSLWTDNVDETRREATRKCPLNRVIISTNGYLAGAHSILRIIAETLKIDPPQPEPVPIKTVANDGFVIDVSMRPNPHAASPSAPANSIPREFINGVPSESGMVPVILTMKPDEEWFTLRLQADDESSFEETIQSAIQSPESAMRLESFRTGAAFRAGLVAVSMSQAITSLQEILSAWKRGVRTRVFDRHGAFLWNGATTQNRVGWVFPGQGSQYSGTPAIFQEDSHAEAYLQSFDRLLKRWGEKPLRDRLCDPESRLGNDIWWTQLWVLAVGSSLADSLVRYGQRPDVVLGHSFGECTAALHTGVLSLEQSLHFAKLRSDAVAMTLTQTGKLLSVREQPSRLRGILLEHRLDCVISHHNSPQQTVIAGTESSIDRAKQVLDKLNIASVLIAVPAAFHTPMMSDAQRVLRNGFAPESLRPPRSAFLSATTSSYLAEPKEIIESLTSQLTRPVLYSTSVARMAQDGCGALIEVGPSDVLTKLNTATVGDQALCLSLDGRYGTHATRLGLIELVTECVSGHKTEAAFGSVVDADHVSADIQPPQASIPDPAHPVEVIDVTWRSRTAEKEKSAVNGNRSVDATSEVWRRVDGPMRSAHDTFSDRKRTESAMPALAPTSMTVHNESATQQTTSSQRLTAPHPVDPIERFLIDFVVDQTGYDRHVVDLDADLESELGIDSIKKAQLVGEVVENYQLQNIELGRLTLADFTTLRSIQDFVRDHSETQPPVPVSTPVIGDRTQASPTSQGAEDSSDAPPAWTASDVLTWDEDVPSSGACRFVLEMVEKPRHEGLAAKPIFSGDVIIFGANDVASELAGELERNKVRCHFIRSDIAPDELDSQLHAIWSTQETPHLFLTSAHDADALRTLDVARWNKERSGVIDSAFRLCQKWMARMIDSGLMNSASLVACTNMGGEFGFGRNVIACESGALAGLTKAMMIEAWMRGFRDTSMRVVEPLAGATTSEYVEGLMRELAAPSYEQEIAVRGSERKVIRARYAPLQATSTGERASVITPGGVWVVSGGARGITSLVAKELSKRYGLKLALLGKAPLPEVCDDVRRRAVNDRVQLKREVMQRAEEEGRNTLEAWRDFEKEIEIDAMLVQCEQEGIEAIYRSVDVADVEAVARVLGEIRSDVGPIRGVVHGAGVGQDARFDRKRLDKVRECIAAKIDGCLALAEATRNDPLEWFVGFGSISGRFGANGHTDYSLANDMLAKCIDRLAIERPSVRCVTFHWHAWGDAGMATKPETKLALEMIGMEFMPASVGLNHFLNELEFGGQSREVLITDRNYVRKFFHELGPANGCMRRFALLDPENRRRLETTCDGYLVTLDPQRDRFLNQHRVGQRPTLPFVIAIELMAEATSRLAGGQRVRRVTGLRAHHALKFDEDQPMAIEVIRVDSLNPGDQSKQVDRSAWQIRADLRRKDGRLVESDRVYFEGVFETRPEVSSRPQLGALHQKNWDFKDIQYLPETAPVFHGESLRCLRQLAVDGKQALGRIATPSPLHLGGEHRPANGWSIPCATMDAVLYAAAMLVYEVTKEASLPVSFGEIVVGRMPEPGEPTLVHLRVLDVLETSVVLDADLVGQNEESLLSIRQYTCGYLRSPVRLTESGTQRRTTVE